MKIRLIFPLALFSAILIAALATGSSLLLLIAIIIGLSVLFSLASVLWAASTIKISVQYSDQTIRRGEDTSVILQTKPPDDYSRETRRRFFLRYSFLYRGGPARHIPSHQKA